MMCLLSNKSRNLLDMFTGIYLLISFETLLCHITTVKDSLHLYLVLFVANLREVTLIFFCLSHYLEVSFPRTCC